MSHVELNGIDYFYHVKGSGPPLVLLHGFTGSSANWLEVIQPFSEHVQVILIDLPGHGRSGSPPTSQRYGMENVGRDLITFVEALHLPGVNLLGYSMGGRLALYMAVRYPSLVRNLIIESASPGLETIREREARIESDNNLASEIELNGVSSFVAEWQKLPIFATQQGLPAERKEILRQQRLNNSASGLANSLRGMGTGQQPSLWTKLGSINLPVLILAGELDKKYLHISRRMAAKIPRARLKIITGAGHNIHLEKPEIYISTVLDFLQGIRGAVQH